LAPGPSAFFQPYPLYLMMFLLFLSFLSLRIDAVWETVRRRPGMVIWLVAVKLLLLPALLYGLCRAVMPDYALGVLLLAGISTGVVAPFIAGILAADMALVLMMVVLTSLLVPLTLPALVKFLPGQEFEIPFLNMFRMLFLTICIPLTTAEVCRRLPGGLTAALIRRRFPISLAAFALINLGVFSRYATFFHQNPGTLLAATLVAMVLGICLSAAGLLAAPARPADQQVAAAVAFNNMNNVLIIVFAAQFFGPLEPTLAAVYMVPFFGVILPLRAYQRRRTA